MYLEKLFSKRYWYTLPTLAIRLRNWTSAAALSPNKCASRIQTFKINFKPHKRALASAHCWFGGCSRGTADLHPRLSEKSPKRYTPPSSIASTYTNTGYSPPTEGTPQTNPATPTHTPHS